MFEVSLVKDNIKSILLWRCGLLRWHGSNLTKPHPFPPVEMWFSKMHGGRGGVKEDGVWFNKLPLIKAPHNTHPGVTWGYLTKSTKANTVFIQDRRDKHW